MSIRAEKINRSIAALSDLYKALDLLKSEYSDNPQTYMLLAEGPISQIENITIELNETAGLQDLSLARSKLKIRLVGRRASWGEMPSSVLMAFLNSARTGIQSIANFDLYNTTRGRPNDSVRAACDFEVAAFAPGSFQVFLDLPTADKNELLENPHTKAAEKALITFIEAAMWASSDSSASDFIESFDNHERAKIVLRALKSFVPQAKGGIEFVELSTSLLETQNETILKHDVYTKITDTLKSLVESGDEIHVGTMREINLDKQTFHLVSPSTDSPIQCSYSDDMSPTMANYLDRQIKVTGHRQMALSGADGVLTVSEVELSLSEEVSPKT